MAGMVLTRCTKSFSMKACRKAHVARLAGSVQPETPQATSKARSGICNCFVLGDRSANACAKR